MTDLDPEIWKNKTLGAASTEPFLDEVEAQDKEDHNARIDDREPRVAVHHPRYPKFMDPNTAPSRVQQITWQEPGTLPEDTPSVIEGDDDLVDKVVDDDDESVETEDPFNA